MCGCSVLICPEGKRISGTNKFVCHILIGVFFFQNKNFTCYSFWNRMLAKVFRARIDSRPVVVFGETVPSAESLRWAFGEEF
ncbi:hypothetical protein CEXT_417251 [Caerostris extrusa]|uniref:Uncharacterized protein n=1 Tax=Caerostris extrusa TaxID=172846 RepID=A0AAV4PBT0_CAEEX|nr:hypothetical protein CEXT_417251 [Caerostris extrusa]